MVGYENERVLGMQQAYADINAALHGAFAIQSALYHRERYGAGQYVEVGQIEALLSTMPEPVLTFTMTGEILGTLGNTHPMMAVHNNYPCKGDDVFGGAFDDPADADAPTVQEIAADLGDYATLVLQ